MRRPALHHPHTSRTGWVHPYAPNPFLFYADGGDDSTADAATDTESPKPSPPAVRTFTQDEVEKLAAKEKAQGKRAGASEALTQFAADHGFSTVDDAKAFIEEARKAREAQLSEQEKREQALAAEKKQVEQERAALAAEKKLMVRERALSRLGAADSEDTPNLQYALALLDQELRDQPGADETAIAEAAEKVKGRLPNLFGAAQQTAVDPAAAPPAPTGLPSSGMPRPGASQPKPGERGLEMLRRRGKLPAA